MNNPRYSFLTSVFDPPFDAFLELVSAFWEMPPQLSFEWIIVDNGSRDAALLDALDVVQDLDFVFLTREANNLGIVGGMRTALKAARGQFVVPVDSDDVVWPRVMLDLDDLVNSAPKFSIAYTNEDKIEGYGATARRNEEYLKPEWDPVLFSNSAYIAHMGIFDRQRALTLGVYDESTPEFAHDWDTFTRFWRAGETIFHIPLTAYSWRKHAGSTSSNILSKPQAPTSQIAVMRKMFAGNVEEVILESNPWLPGGRDWVHRVTSEGKLRRLVIPNQFLASPEPLDSATTGQNHRKEPKSHEFRSEFWADLSRCRDEGTMAWLAIETGGFLDYEEAKREAHAIFELFPDCIAVGGPLLKEDKVVGGYGQFLDVDCYCPDFGKAFADSGYFAQSHKRRTVGYIEVGSCILHPERVLKCLKEYPDYLPLAALPIWLSAQGITTGNRVVASPWLAARIERVPPIKNFQQQYRFVVNVFRDFLPASHCPSTTDSDSARNNKAGDQLWDETSHDFFKSAQLRRKLQLAGKECNQKILSVITTIPTDRNFELLHELFLDLRAQLGNIDQWIIVVHGTLDEAQQAVLNFFDEHRTILVKHFSCKLNIAQALDEALSMVESDYYVVVDADDRLEPDFVSSIVAQLLSWPLTDLVFSDEDHLVNGQYRSPFYRHGWDPVLALESSYIWHAIAIRTAFAKQHALYRDSRFQWVEDWHAMSTAAIVGATVKHVPEVLYHWRQHQESTTNRPLELRSMNNEVLQNLSAARSVLEKVIAARDPEGILSARCFPYDRGIPEMYITTDSPWSIPVVNAMNIEWKLIEDVTANAILFVDSDCTPIHDYSNQEITKLFLLHPHIFCVTGRTIDNEGMVVGEPTFACRHKQKAISSKGQSWLLPGPFALLLKSQTVSEINPQVFALKRETILTYMDHHLGAKNGPPPSFDPRDVVRWVLSREEDKIAYSPLLIARVAKPR